MGSFLADCASERRVGGSRKISALGLLPALLTVNEHDLDHGDDEEGHGIQMHLYQDSSDQEHQQDGYQAAQDPNRLGDPRPRQQRDKR